MYSERMSQTAPSAEEAEVLTQTQMHQPPLEIKEFEATVLSCTWSHPCPNSARLDIGNQRNPLNFYRLLYFLIIVVVYLR